MSVSLTYAGAQSPDLGGGDSRLLIGVSIPGSPNYSLILAKYSGDDDDRDGHNLDGKSLQDLNILYASFGDPSELRTFHGITFRCYPFNGQRGFARIWRGPAFVDLAGYDLIPTDFVILEWSGKKIIAETMDEKTLNQSLGLSENDRYLGMLDDWMFYSKNEKNTGDVYAKNMTTKAIRWWHLKHDVFEFDGVLRSRKKDFAFGVIRKGHHFLSTSPNEFALMDVSMKDAAEEPSGDHSGNGK